MLYKGRCCYDLQTRLCEKDLAYADAPFVKILTGVRRCGKSTVMAMLREELIHRRSVVECDILNYNFDSLEYEGMTAKELFADVRGRLSNGHRTYLFFDEIQEIDGWEKVVNSLMSEHNVDIYVTGSNSRMMSSEISTYLTGRYISFRIYPLSFSEYLDFRKEYSTPDDTKRELARYLRLGGFPAVHLRDYSADEVYPIVRDIYNSTIFTDIVKRHDIRAIDRFERVVRYVFDNVGNTFSASSVAKYIKSEGRVLDNETVYNYISALESAYILHRCSRYDIKGKEILKTQEKFYLSDPSLRYCVLGYNDDDVSAMLENVVYLELLRRGYDVCVGKFDGYEIDFVATRREEKIYVQVAREIVGEETRLREYGRLLEIRDNYPKYVLLVDEFAGGNYQGIKTLHVADFLLSNDY